MFYIVGLGNPGTEYTHTRHNVGWIALDAFVAKHNLSSPHTSAKFTGRIAHGVIHGQEISVLYPDTYMNASGSAVAKLVSKADIPHLIVLHDDIDLPLGHVKISIGRGDGGHKGLRSIIASLNSSNFIRVRIGIAKRHFLTGSVVRPKGAALERFVLGNFTPKEQTVVQEVASVCTQILDTIVEQGVQQAMNTYN